jgi:hypothetical protein
MKTLKLFLLLLVTALVSQLANAATIPAGTTILMRTTHNILSGDPSGRKIEGVLANNLTAGGKVVVPAGAHVRGVVKSPKFNIGSTSRPLTLRLTQIVVHGHAIPVKSEDLEVASDSPWTIGPRRVQVTAARFLLDRGTILQFHLKQPVEV